MKSLHRSSLPYFAVILSFATTKLLKRPFQLPSPRWKFELETSNGYSVSWCFFKTDATAERHTSVSVQSVAFIIVDTVFFLSGNTLLKWASSLGNVPLPLNMPQSLLLPANGPKRLLAIPSGVMMPCYSKQCMCFQPLYTAFWASFSQGRHVCSIVPTIKVTTFLENCLSSNSMLYWNFWYKNSDIELIVFDRLPADIPRISTISASLRGNDRRVRAIANSLETRRSPYFTPGSMLITL